METDKTILLLTMFRLRSKTVLPIMKTAITNPDFSLKEALIRIWCGANRLGDTSASVYPAGQLL